MHKFWTRTISVLRAAVLLAVFAAAPARAQSTVSLIRALKAFTAPVMHVDSFALSVLPPGTTTTFTFALTAAPIPAMGAIVQFTSSQVGGDVYTPIAAIQPSIVFTLPTYAPFTAVDVVKITYWSTN